MNQNDLILDIRNIKTPVRTVNFERINSQLVRMNFEAIRTLRMQQFTWKEIIETFKEQFAHVRNIDKLAISPFQAAYARLEKKVAKGYTITKVNIQSQRVVEKPIEPQKIDEQETVERPVVQQVETEKPVAQPQPKSGVVNSPSAVAVLEAEPEIVDTQSAPPDPGKQVPSTLSMYDANGEIRNSSDILNDYYDREIVGAHPSRKDRVRKNRKK